MQPNRLSKAFKSPFLGTVPLRPSRDAGEKSSGTPENSVRSTERILKLFDKKPTVENIVTPGGTVEETRGENLDVVNENISKASSNIGKMTYTVVYGKKSTKKHKTWEGDGLLEVDGTTAVLKDMEGKIVGRTKVNPVNVAEGLRICMGNKEIEIIELATQIVDGSKDSGQVKTDTEEPPAKKVKTTQISRPYFPVGSSGAIAKYEPLVMPQPSVEVQWAAKNTSRLTEVSVDYCLATVLRPHQRYGVAFLYQCILGFSTADCYGAILADEMGLGKTLQCIALVWTLLKQGPYGSPVLRRVLVVVPSSLCGTWSKEFTRWLGSHRISTYVVDAKNKPEAFSGLPKIPVMIISYEMFARCYDEVDKIGFDLLICDEGHRLKNSTIKVSKLLYQLNCKRRILLSGTPVQNDLQEFFALVDFVNPGVLGSNMEYRKHYEEPIVASQQPDSSVDVTLLGKERAAELNERTKGFILRRTQEVIDKYLPKKHEMVIFCRLTPEQTDLYAAITNCWFSKAVILEGSVPHLTIISALKKLCNHPSLLKNEKSNLFDTIGKNIEDRMPKSMRFDMSGKVAVVEALLKGLKGSKDKLVLVSHFTQTLDLLGKVCEAGTYKYCRLDGTTPTALRNNVVERFNSVNSDCSVFLLSAKAGGVGLNLSGASKLVLFDSDWNPASDQQAMARVWRDGQKKSVYIYRLLTSGTIEEKIYQRQISKTSLSEAVVDPSNPALMKLSSDELKDLFTHHTNTSSLTHDLMKCECEGRGEIRKKYAEGHQEEKRDFQITLQSKTHKNQHLTMNQLLEWQHYARPLPLDLLQELKLGEVSESVSYIFKNSTV